MDPTPNPNVNPDPFRETSQDVRSPPRFQQGQLVHLTAPLNTSAMSTWLFEGEVSDLEGHPHHPFSTDSAASDNNHTTVPVTSDSRNSPEDIETSLPTSSVSHNIQPPSSTPQPCNSLPADPPISMLLTEKLFSLIPHLSLLNTIRHATVWHVEEVIPAASDQEEHRYRLCPAERVTVYVSESAMASAHIWVGTVVRKRDQKQGFWTVVGLSVREKVVWADIVNAEGHCEVVRTNELRMLPEVEALEILMLEE